MSRDFILQNIHSGKAEATMLPVIDIRQFQVDADVQEIFMRSVESVGGKTVVVKNKDEASHTISKLFPDAKGIISQVEGIDIGTFNIKSTTSAKDLDKLDLVVIEGQFGVAENGAVWVSDKNLVHRSIPFIASHVVLVLGQEKIVKNMHEACARISEFAEGYGVFISGPSKTADIEQSLVIGAQGALSLTVCILGKH